MGRTHVTAVRLLSRSGVRLWVWCGGWRYRGGGGCGGGEGRLPEGFVLLLPAVYLSRSPAAATSCVCVGGRPTMRGKRTYGGRPGQRVEEQGTWAAQKHSEAGYGRPVDRGVWTAKTVKRPRQQPAHPQYANYWAPLTRKRHTMPHSAQSQHANYWAPRTRKRHQQEHRPQQPTESSDPTQHAKGRTGDRPGPRKGATTRRNVTQGVGVRGEAMLTGGGGRGDRLRPFRASALPRAGGAMRCCVPPPETAPGKSLPCAAGPSPPPQECGGRGGGRRDP